MARYQVIQRQAHGMTAYFLLDTIRRAEAVLYPELGNNCAEFRTTPDPYGRGPDGGESAPVDLFLPPDNIEDLRTNPFHGGQPILFPFPNRVRNGAYTFEGQTYHMDKLLAKGWDRGAGQAIHGLVGDKPWQVEEAQADDDAAVIRSSLQMDAFPDIAEQYPFPSRITITYRLRDGVLEMLTEVKNTGTKTMPMGFGIHPWFATTLRPGGRLPEALKEITPLIRAEAQVRVPAEAIWELDKLMPTGKVIPAADLGPEFDLIHFKPLDHIFYDHVFTRVRRRDDGWSEGGLRDPVSLLDMYIAADRAFREWVLYAPQSRPVIALEPYTCATDAVNLELEGIDAGLIALPAGQSWHGVIHFGLRLSA